MIRLTKKEKGLLALTSALYLLNALLLILTTYTIAKVMECAELGQVEKLPVAILVAVGVVLLEKISALGMQASNQWYTSVGEIGIKQKMMKSILWRPLHSFREKDDAYYMNLFTTDTGMYREKCLGSYPWIFYFIGFLLFSGIMLWMQSPVLTIIVLLLSGIPFLGDKLIAGFVQRRREIYSEKSESFTNSLKELIEGYESIRMGKGRDAFRRHFDEESINVRHAGANVVIADSISRQISDTSANILRLVALAAGTVLVVRGEMRAAMLFATLDYAAYVSYSFSNLAYYKMAIQSTKPIMSKLEKESEQYDEEDHAAENDIVPFLEYKSVSFSFDERQLYKEFSYRFEPGKCYAIVGESGSGKSTLMKLFLKYYDNYTGEILFNGRDIREMNEQAIYEQVGVISQSPWLFNESLYDNITMRTGMPQKDSEEYRMLLETLNLSGLAEQVGDSKLGDFGDHISGGERQRISLARALRNQSKLLIFDEPTTGLDPENVHIINELIFKLKGVTRIVISHDWSEEYWKEFDGIIKIE